jgi:hypothetical protein
LLSITCFAYVRPAASWARTRHGRHRDGPGRGDRQAAGAAGYCQPEHLTWPGAHRGARRLVAAVCFGGSGQDVATAHLVSILIVFVRGGLAGQKSAPYGQNECHSLTYALKRAISLSVNHMLIMS